MDDDGDAEAKEKHVKKSSVATVALALVLCGCETTPDLPGRPMPVTTIEQRYLDCVRYSTRCRSLQGADACDCACAYVYGHPNLTTMLAEGRCPVTPDGQYRPSNVVLEDARP